PRAPGYRSRACREAGVPGRHGTAPVVDHLGDGRRRWARRPDRHDRRVRAVRRVRHVTDASSAVLAARTQGSCIMTQTRAFVEPLGPVKAWLRSLALGSVGQRVYIGDPKDATLPYLALSLVDAPTDPGEAPV